MTNVTPNGLQIRAFFPSKPTHNLASLDERIW
jgi:hypothetical protein